MSKLDKIMQIELNNAAKALRCNTYCTRQFGILLIKRNDNDKTLAAITHDGQVNRFERDANYQLKESEGAA